MKILIMILSAIAMLILIVGGAIFAFQSIQDYLEERKQ